LYWKLELRAMTKSSEKRKQLGDDVLGNAAAEIVLLRIAAEVGQGEHRDAGPIGKRQP
jgi:hypothetical protein